MNTATVTIASVKMDLEKLEVMEAVEAMEVVEEADITSEVIECAEPACTIKTFILIYLLIISSCLFNSSVMFC